MHTVTDLAHAQPTQESTSSTTAATSAEIDYMRRIHEIFAQTAVPPVPARVLDQPVERQAIVFVPGPGNAFIGVPRSELPPEYLHPAPTPTLQPAPAPAPLIDRRAQFIAATGIAFAGIGWGLSQAFDGLGHLLSSAAGLSTGALLGISAMVVAARLPLSQLLRGITGRRADGDTYITNNSSVTNNNHPKWFGRTDTSTTTNTTTNANRS
ncbi:hypothetical protein LN042_24120 [Kitasatospora sp. RB6PN24]|uniref:hypothetical protein n=1 Tax=Kitasatospora humi TaxID=2893891 RepID=UPI001E546391|nr:hypothetical protein [Kitasatospora humi]MCC9310116.1 hypothetical protein [Kitasatospora humi]